MTELILFETQNSCQLCNSGIELIFVDRAKNSVAAALRVRETCFAFSKTSP